MEVWDIDSNDDDLVDRYYKNVVQRADRNSEEAQTLTYSLTGRGYST